MSHPAYPEMKPSGVEWLGDVPKQWAVRRLKSVASVRLSNVDKKSAEGQESVLLCNYTDVYYNAEITNSLGFMEATAPAEQVSRFRLNEGDVLITKDSETPNDIAVPAVVTDQLNGVLCGYHLAMLRPSSVMDGRFLRYSLASPPFRDHFRATAHGVTRFGLSLDDIGTAFLLLPPLAEQQQIAAFLDRKTAELDTVLRLKERQLALLAEKRQALISQAVTRGLDPTVPLKPSGIPWLGDVPEHWDIVSLGYRYEVQLGKMLDATRITGNHLAPYLRNVDVQWDRINIEDLGVMDFLPSERQRFALQDGDLLVCEGGEVGRCAIWHGELAECYYQKAIHRLRPSVHGEVPRFLFHALLTTAKRGVFVSEGNPNTIDHLPAEKLKKYQFAFPPSTEQRAIVACLDTETARMDGIGRAIQTQIDKVREYRQALISAAVTGKIDVRNEGA